MDQLTDVTPYFFCGDFEVFHSIVSVGDRRGMLPTYRSGMRVATYLYIPSNVPDGCYIVL